MARVKNVDTQVGLTRGFVTEFTEMNFPREAAKDISNCIIDSDGSIRRRPGVDIEPSATVNNINGGLLSSPTITTVATNTLLWTAVANSGTLNLVVQQIGTTVQFYTQLGTLSNNLVGEVDLSSYATDVLDFTREKIDAVSGLGSLFIVNKYSNILKIDFNPADETFTVTQLTVRIRDFDGVDDGLEIDERPSVLTVQHYYNLTNQGWTDENLNLFAGLSESHDICAAISSPGGALATDPRGWPSNADIMHVGIVTNASGDLEFDPNYVEKSYFGNTPAPKGHYILEAFNKDYDTALGCAGNGISTVPTRPEALAFHQGRLFFTSPVVQNAVTGIYYSQQLINDSKAADCFQEADPTADDINDLIATDGGFLPAPGIGQVYAMREMANGVVVIASNGVWYITGAETGSGVSATSIRLDKISDAGALGAGSVVVAEDSLAYWGVDGIMQVTLDVVNGNRVANISEKTIQEYYITLPADARSTASAVYVPEERKIYWAYRADTREATAYGERGYNQLLVLDFNVGGFYKYLIEATEDFNVPEIVGLSKVSPLVTGTVQEDVLELNGLPVTELDGITPVTERVTADSGHIATLKLACLYEAVDDAGYGMVFSEFISRGFTEWYSLSGVVEQGMPMSSFVEFSEFDLGAKHTRGTAFQVHSYFRRVSKNLEVGGYYELPPLGSNFCYTSLCTNPIGAVANFSRDDVTSLPTSGDITDLIVEVHTAPHQDSSGKFCAFYAYETDAPGGAFGVDNAWLYIMAPDDNCNWTEWTRLDAYHTDPNFDETAGIGWGVFMNSTASIVAVNKTELFNNTTGYADGYVQVWELLDCVWTSRTRIYQERDTEGSEAFGQRMAVSDDGSVLVVGSPDEHWAAAAGVAQGAIDIFEYNTVTSEYDIAYTLQSDGRNLTLDGMDRYHFRGFGEELEISSNGNILVVSEGTYNHTDLVGNDSYGEVHILRRASGVWSVVQREERPSASPDPYSASPCFGTFLDMSEDGTTIAIADTSQPHSGAVTVGQVQVWENADPTTGTWALADTLLPSNDLITDAIANPGEFLSAGIVVKLSGDGNTLIMGCNALPYNTNWSVVGITKLLEVFRKDAQGDWQYYGREEVITEPGGWGTDVELNYNGTKLTVGTSNPSQVDSLEFSVRELP
jgi:hypothetical protein